MGQQGYSQGYLIENEVVQSGPKKSETLFPNFSQKLRFKDHRNLLDVLVKCDSGTVLLGDQQNGERDQRLKSFDQGYLI